MKVLLLVGFGLLLVGSLLLVGAYFLYRRTARFRQRAVSTEGVVTDFKTGTDDDGDSVYYPIFQYRAPSGQEYTICSNTGTNPPGFKKGQSVGVLYDPDQPTEARLDTFVQLWLTTIIVSGLGSLFAIFGIVLLVVSIRG
jgi:hypothetical protein